MKRPLLAVLTAGLAASMSFAGMTLATPSANSAAAADLVCVNPMAAATPIGSNAGFTIKTTGDAVFANSETEGSIAVGGVATFTTGSGRYPVFHQAAGNGNYGVPTIDGDTTRVLLNQFGADGNSIVQVSHRGNGAPTPDGVSKVVNLTPGFEFHQGYDPGATYVKQPAGNQQPQLESQVSDWDGTTGEPSMKAKNSFTSYFPEDSGATVLKQDSGVAWKDATPSGTSGQITITLDPSGPNQINFSQIAGVLKFELKNASDTAPLVIRVKPSDVVNGTLTLPSYYQPSASDSASISRILWDMSALSGTVNLTTPDSPLRGSFYAPNADLVIPSSADRELEGQVIAKSFQDYASGHEIHTSLFSGKLCVPSTPTEKTYAVGDIVWVDADRDGVQDDSEVLEGVKVTLLDKDGKSVAETTTGADGRYLFDELAAGEYQVKFELTADQAAKYEFTSVDAGGDDAVDSDADPATGLTKVFTLDGSDSALTKEYEDQEFKASEGVDPTWDAGVVLKEVPAPGKVSVGDFVWVDSNGDGRQDEGEPGIPGVVLVLTGPDGSPVTDVNGNLVETVTTDKDGRYSFDDLPVLDEGESYTVSIDKDASADALEPYVPTKAGEGDREGDSSDWSAVSEGLTKDGDRDPSLDFGFVKVPEPTPTPSEPVEPTPTPSEPVEPTPTPSEPVEPTPSPASPSGTPTTTAPSGSGPLAVTGGNTAQALGLGILMLLVGGAGVLVARRKHDM